MPSASTCFQRAVTKSAPRETRREAIRELGRLDAVRQLKTITRTNGLHGVFRRDAVAELEALGATDALETIAADRAVDPAIRKQARR
ncbi:MULTISPECIES: hypothetical protein [Halorientalis]|jgi:hypothetical protein|uniref:hypothetical protein n=1 Tax=Halorientalis TaxID=1073987 RepID=UPI000B8A243A|nr:MULTISPECIES: hypothetical protein [Halorientalis]